MDFKKKSKQLKNVAKEMGYEIKLTHAQEILARMMGHRSRHSILEQIKSNQELENPFVEIKEEEIDYYYYRVDIFYSNKDSFSVYFRDKDLYDMEYDAAGRAYDIGLLTKEDLDHVTGVDETLTKEEYENTLGQKNTSCKFCEQHYNKDFFTKGRDGEEKCKHCQEREVIAYISTDDNKYDYEMYDVRLDLEAHHKDKTGAVEEIVNGAGYGPDSHTDNLLYNSFNELVQEVEEYLNVVNKRDTVGFGISIEEDSFNKWWKRYNI